MKVTEIEMYLLSVAAATVCEENLVMTSTFLSALPSLVIWYVIVTPAWLPARDVLSPVCVAPMVARDFGGDTRNAPALNTAVFSVAAVKLAAGRMQVDRGMFSPKITVFDI